MLRRKHYSAKTQVIKTSVPYGSTKVEWLENVGDEYILCGNVNYKVGDIIETSALQQLTVLDGVRRSEGRNANFYDGTYYFWGVIENNTYYAGTGTWGETSFPADFEWHIFRNKSAAATHNPGFYVDDTKIRNGGTMGNNWGENNKIGLWKTMPSGFINLLSRKKWWKLSLNNKVIYNLIPSVDKTGTPCMFDLVSRKNFYNAGTGQFIYPTISTTYSLRRPQAEWAKITDTGVHKIYHTPIDYEGSIEDYAIENGYKRLIETESPSEEGKYYSFKWVETDDTLTTEWFEIDPPQEEIFEENLDNLTE